MEIKSALSRFTVYQYMAFFLVILAFASAFFYGFGYVALLPVAMAVLTATVLDLFLERAKYKEWSFPKCALI